MIQTLRILGIDPGLRHTGWGVVALHGSRLSHIAHGVISPDPELSLADRLGVVFSAVSELAKTHDPHAAGVEETIVNVNGRSALKLGQARGAAMAALAVRGLPVSEFAPKRIKQTVVGTGSADKMQIAFMVKALLPQAGKTTSDSADALACAICAAHHLPAGLGRVA
ncbi:MAG: crossover junction endodeoxyribonuclease RuvC [Pseudomonadota bacterium]